MIKNMNKGFLIGLATLAVSTVAVTALAQVDSASTSTPPEVVATTSQSIQTDITTSTTTDVATLTSTDVLSTATPEVAPITETLPAPPSLVPVPGSAPAVSIPPKPTPPTDSGIVIAQAIAQLEADHFQKTGKYLQVLPDNQLPEYESGSVAERLGTPINANARVDVYESPKGAGYQITFQDGNTFYSFGYGPEWVDRTYSYVVSPAAQASSTPATVQ
jgi:hypothetical protein